MVVRNLKIGFTVGALTATSILFNNMDFFKWDGLVKSPLANIHELSRTQQAKEVLGDFYFGSAAQKLEGRQNLNEAIYAKVAKSLSAQWKGQARALTRLIIQESAAYQMDPVLVLAMIQTESRFNPLAKGLFGEIGLMQIKPGTAQWIAKKYDLEIPAEHTLYNPEQNIRYGMAYLHYLRSQFPGNAQEYISAYNMGPTNVRKLRKQNIEPAIYSNRVVKNYISFYENITKQDYKLIALN